MYLPQVNAKHIIVLVIVITALNCASWSDPNCQKWIYALRDDEDVVFRCASYDDKNGFCPETSCEFEHFTWEFNGSSAFIACESDKTCPDGFRCCYDLCYCRRICRRWRKFCDGDNHTTSTTMMTTLGATDIDDSTVVTDPSLPDPESIGTTTTTISTTQTPTTTTTMTTTTTTTTTTPAPTTGTLPSPTPAPTPTSPTPAPTRTTTSITGPGEDDEDFTFSGDGPSGDGPSGDHNLPPASYK